jgi:hypothetical protein
MVFGRNFLVANDSPEVPSALPTTPYPGGSGSDGTAR